MISKKIVDTDLFLDMPTSSRLLYYDLLIRADDDGFVGNPKRITKMIGASDDDLRILIAKRFIIPFESGICVIKDWRIHNYIKSDRYQPTQYVEEKAQLMLTSNKSYELIGTKMEPERLQSGTKMDTQVRLGKDRLELDKDRDNISTTTGDVAEKLINPDLAEINQYWDKNISPITPAIAQEFNALLQKGVKAEIIIAAISEAIRSATGRPSYNYVKTIIDRWIAQGIDTLAKVKEDREKHGTKANGKGAIEYEVGKDGIKHDSAGHVVL